MSYLKKAKNIPIERREVKDKKDLLCKLELVNAYLKGEVSARQSYESLGMPQRSNFISVIPKILKDGIYEGFIEIKLINQECDEKI